MLAAFPDNHRKMAEANKSALGLSKVAKTIHVRELRPYQNFHSALQSAIISQQGTEYSQH